MLFRSVAVWTADAVAVWKGRVVVAGATVGGVELTEVALADGRRVAQAGSYWWSTYH